MIRSISSVCLSILLSAICAYPIDYVVKGQISGADGQVLYIYDYDKKINIDSTNVSDGKFCFKGTYDRPAFVRVEGGRYYSNCVLDTLAVLDFDTHFPSSGSILNEKLIELKTKDKAIDDELDKFSHELKSHGFKQPELGDIYKHLYDRLRPDRIELYSNAIIENPNGVGESAMLSFGGMWGLTPEEWESAYTRMPAYLKELSTAEYFNNLYIGLRNSQPGKPFIDFSAKTLDGKDVMLSDYAGKGKYVLMDFWASWCGPCKKEAEKTLRPLYEKYKDDERFMILGVAVWDSHDKTLSALEKLKYPWTQIIDADKIPMELYGFNAIPMIILLDPNGVIVGRGLRGNDIIEKVDSVLGK